ncbi:hypothetical protein AAY24_12520 [Sedimenticola thiotaurini]|uniref:Metallo-beta-lactamase domain-containing protein n=1 Tax=Sedimenticola thiotaurini TaxID=1543721 RepID=A0A0F7K5K4_9GAMM|nr:hypothetical protein AAY24_12520 [Sedimenticola thiotaurini]
MLLLSVQAGAASDLALQKVADNVYAIVGELSNRSPENLGNNATFGFVVTSEGVVLIDSGGTYQGAKRIHQVIQSVTDQPVVTVINSGGQDHRWLGNGYFKKQGARIVASADAVADQQARSRDQFIMLGNLVGEAGLAGTEAQHADQTFDEELRLEIGGVKFEIYHTGQAHTPGDSYIWLPEQQVMFTGDIVYVERMLGVGSQSNSKSWIEVYQSMAAFSPKVVVPGHGHPATLEKANADTLGYLKFLRNKVTGFYDDGGDISEIGSIDQSRYHYLLNHETLAGRNAQQVYTELEWE